LLQQSVHGRCGTEPAFQNYRQRQEAEKARSATIERQAVQSQLQMLQAQIEPHMLFNTLANLQG
jgi:sensor histidine kinase YesM